MKHRFDLKSGYCTKCGASIDDVVNGLRPTDCPATENVIAISHRLQREKKEE